MFKSLSPRAGTQRIWYIPPKELIEESDDPRRACALFINPQAWEEINSHFTRDADRLELQRLEKELKEFKKKTSYEMTKNWENSIENTQKRRLETLKQHREKIQEERMKAFFEIRAEQAKEKEKYIELMRRLMFYVEPPPRNMNSALILSDTYYERQKQIELEKKIHEIELEENRALVDWVKKCDAEGTINIYDDWKKKLNKEIAHRKMLMEQILSNKKMRKEQKEKQMKEEIQDLVNMQDEIKMIADNNRKEIEERKMNIKRMVDDAVQKRREFQEKCKREEDYEDKIIIVLEEAKNKIKKTREETEAKALKEKMRILEKMGSKILTATATKKAEEEEWLHKSYLEKEEEAQKKIKISTKYKEKMRTGLLEIRKKHLEDRAIKEDKERQKKQWDMINRFKTAEMNKKYNEALLVKKKNKQNLIKNTLLKQVEERVTNEKIQKEKDIAEFKNKMSATGAENKQFLDYAEEVIDEWSKKEDRLMYPLYKVVEKYKRENGLLPPVRRRPLSNEQKVLKITEDFKTPKFAKNEKKTETLYH